MPLKMPIKTAPQGYSEKGPRFLIFTTCPVCRIMYKITQEPLTDLTIKERQSASYTSRRYDSIVQLCSRHSEGPGTTASFIQ